MKRSLVSLIVPIGAALLAGTMSNVASAGGASNPAAESLFAEGKRLLAQGNPVEACRKFEESHRLEVTIGARFQVAQCHERVGRTASAWSGYLEVAAMAKSRGQASREKAARDKAADLEPQLSRLVVHVAKTNIPGLIIRRNGIVLTRADWSAPLPIDPGHVTIEASAPGYHSATVLVDVTSALPPQKTVLEAHIPELEPLSSLSSASSSVSSSDHPQTPVAALVDDAVPTPPSEPPSARMRAGERSRDLHKVALAGAGASLLAFGTGIAFTVSALHKNSASEPHCRGTMCDPTGAGLRSDAVTAGDFATVMFVGGAALLTASAALWLLTPPSAELLKQEPRGRRSTTTVAFGVGGVSVRGTW